MLNCAISLLSVCMYARYAEFSAHTHTSWVLSQSTRFRIIRTRVPYESKTKTPRLAGFRVTLKPQTRGGQFYKPQTLLHTYT